MKDHTFTCDTAPEDTITVVSNEALLYREVWVRLLDGHEGVVMLKPRKARRLAKALRKAAKKAER